MQKRVPPCRFILHARVVKKTRSHYKRKWYTHVHISYFKGSFLDLVVLLNEPRMNAFPDHNASIM